MMLINMMDPEKLLHTFRTNYNGYYFRKFSNCPKLDTRKFYNNLLTWQAIGQKYSKNTSICSVLC